MTLNLIIPVFNNYDGLINTIMSLNTYYSKHNINIIIINDCSTDNKNYKHIINQFKSFYNIQVHKTPYNMGAGNARQYGLDKINNGYVMLMDAGDIIYSPTELIEYLNFVEQNPQTYLFSPRHFEQDEQGNFSAHSPRNYRIHGKIYQVAFLKKYNIKFNKEYPNSNEDMGFNMICRIYCRYLQSINPNIQYYLEYDIGIVLWTFDANSLTRKDNYAFFYKQNIGMSKHAIYAINHLLDHGVPIDFMQEDMAEIFVNLYAYYIGTLNQDKSTDDAFNGALEFYETILVPHSLNTDILTQKYNWLVGQLLTTGNMSFSWQLPRVGILDFLLMLDKAYQSNQLQEGVTND